MIIQCQQCQTRFKVGDDKLAAGPIRVRCSKCNHVFMAGGAQQAQQQQTPLPSSGTPHPTTRPTPSAFTPPPPLRHTPQPQMPSSSGGGWNQPSRSGIFRNPSSSGMPGVGAASPQHSESLPPTRVGPPSTSSTSALDPFGQGQQQTVAATPRALNDPFGVGPQATPTKSDPFSGLPTKQTSFPPTMPSSAGDPFAGGGDPFAGVAPTPAPHGSAFPDPFMATQGHSAAALFGQASSAQGAVADPFSMAQPPQQTNNIQLDDGSIEVSIETVSLGQQAPVPPPRAPVDDEQDPFGGLDADVPAPSLYDQPIQPSAPPPSELPGIPPSTAAAPRAASSSSSSGPSPAAVAAAPTTGADMIKLRRAESAQRVKEIAWAAVQGLLLLAFIAVAVVFARGGSVKDVLRGDVRAALGGARSVGGLLVLDAQVSRRTLPSGVDVVIVSGTVKNETSASVSGARVGARFGDASGQPTWGWAWSSIDGIDVEGLVDTAGAAALSGRRPASASLAPGDRAPFVIVVAPAPAEGLRATLDVVPLDATAALLAPAPPAPALAPASAPAASAPHSATAAPKLAPASAPPPKRAPRPPARAAPASAAAATSAG